MVYESLTNALLIINKKRTGEDLEPSKSMYLQAIKYLVFLQPGNP